MSDTAYESVRFVTYTDPAGKITTYAYSAGVLTKVTDPVGNQTKFAYDTTTG